MNKTQLINKLSDDLGVSKTNAKAALEVLLGTIANGVKEHGKVSLQGFGTFSVQTRKARTGRNPQTGETVQIPEKQVVKFKAQF